MDRLELEPPSGLKPVIDDRPRMDEPPPVRLVAIGDVHLPTMVNLAPALDEFYMGLLGFLREPAERQIVYRAENARLIFDAVFDPLPIQRASLRPQGIEVKSLAEVHMQLTEGETEFIEQRDIAIGQMSLLLRDPAGNWVELFDAPLVSL